MYARAGEVLEINYGLYSHYGIVDEFGQVIHNSKKHFKVVSESFEKFSEGKKVKISKITSQNTFLAIEKARQNIGKKYSLFHSNCEHFVRYCHGRKVESKQIQIATVLGVLTIVGIVYKHLKKN